MVSFSGTAAITNRMATVTINDLQCGVTYNITAEGVLNGKIMGPRSPHGKIAAGPCPVITSECTYVTVHAKTSLVCTKIETHFLSPAYSYTH